MATANSVLPLLVMVLRGQQIEADDISYALVLWKYLGVYALVRATVRTDRQIGLCLWVAMLSAAWWARSASCRHSTCSGSAHALVGYYAPFGYTGALAAPRGGSTLALPGGDGRPADPQPRGGRRAVVEGPAARPAAARVLAVVFMAGYVRGGGVLQRPRAARSRCCA